jgi:L1 cell adhesion molecule like protein
LAASDKSTLNSKIDEAIKWLDANQEAEKEEYESRQKELESVANPIITKLYGGAGGAPGGFPGGAAPGGFPGAGGDAGPTVEEVD